MPGTPTANYGFYIGTVGGDSGLWGGDVNTTLTAYVDGLLGNTLGVAITSADVTLTISNWQSNGIFKLTGVLTGDHSLILPFNGATGAGTAVGGKFIVDNQTTGAFNVTVKTVASGSTGVVAPQGSRTSLYSDQTNVMYADDSRIAKLNTVAGNPNGAVTGNAGAVNAPADVLWDRTNQQLYASTGGTTWAPVGLALPSPQGYLTPTSGVPVIPTDVTVSNGFIYYTPYRGNLTPVYNGTSFGVFGAGEIAIGTTGATASSIYDIFVAVVAGVVVCGWGPSWTVGGGSVTPGLRGTGAGSTALQRINGILTNQFSMTLSNPGGAGSPPYAIAANQGTYVGSMFVDASGGQVSFTRSWGGNGAGGLRKWGLWNAYNRNTIVLQGGDAAVSWPYAGSSVWRQSNGAAGNQLQMFCGLAEEEAPIDFREAVQNGTNGVTQIGIGINSTTAPSGYSFLTTSALTGVVVPYSAQFTQPPFLGVFNANMIELGNSGGGGPATFKGTNANMVMTARYAG